MPPAGLNCRLFNAAASMCTQQHMEFFHQRLRRCLQLLNMLHSGIGYSTSHLADEFDVSKRTIFRDFHFLEKAGIAIRYDHKKRGHTLEHHLNLRVSQLSSEELTALFLTAHIFSLSCDQQISHTLQQAIGKLLAQLPSPFREDIGNLLNSVRGNLPSSPWPEGPQSVVNEILSALYKKQQVRITYDPDEATSMPLQLRVTPNCLMTSEGHWYLIGRSSRHRKILRFDLKHIQMAEQVSNPTETTSPDVEPLNWSSIEVQDYGFITTGHSSKCP